MKKAMLGLVMVVMLMGLVGCGTTNTEKSNKESEVNTEVKLDSNGNVIAPTEDKEEDLVNETVVTYAEITKVYVGEPYNYITLTFYRENGSEGRVFDIPYEERFENCEGKFVKVTTTLDAWNSPDYQNIISIEIIEE